MTNPTDPRIEAATLALLETANYEISISAESLRDHLTSEHFGDCTKASCPCMRCICEEAQKEAAYILKAADEAAWLPIESAPHNEKVILGWRAGDGEWREAFDMASYDWKCGDYARGVSRHNKATHWKPRSTGPKP